MRPVAISDSLANLFEKILLIELKRDTSNNSKQFDMAKRSSCQHAIFLINIITRISKQLGKRVYLAAIDATKAFDLIIRQYLWVKLIEMNVQPAIIQSIIAYYNQSLMLIENDSEFSAVFKATNGARQGGPISPRLFAIYVQKHHFIRR